MIVLPSVCRTLNKAKTRMCAISGGTGTHAWYNLESAMSVLSTKRTYVCGKWVGCTYYPPGGS